MNSLIQGLFQDLYRDIFKGRRESMVTRVLVSFKIRQMVEGVARGWANPVYWICNEKARFS
jgi:hypothetical protein